MGEDLEIGEDVLIIGRTSGVIELKLQNMLDDELVITKAEKGKRITFLCDQQSSHMISFTNCKNCRVNY